MSSSHARKSKSIAPHTFHAASSSTSRPHSPARTFARGPRASSFIGPTASARPLLELHRILRRVDADGRILGDVARDLVAILQHAQLLELLDLLEPAERELRELLQQIGAIAVE